MKTLRTLDIVVISDIHLGTYGCHAKELYRYLKSIEPKTLILNGDIIDVWQFRKRYFPPAHLKVLKRILGLAAKGCKVYYLTGNHDEMLRKFSDFSIGNITLADKLLLNIGNKKAWFFHGDVFDASIQNAKWLAKLGGWGYDTLILLNRLTNLFLVKMGKEPYSLSAAIKKGVKSAVKYIGDFENVAAELAVENGYDYVVCGHIHQPQMRIITNKKGACVYLNSGDWIENLTALEYNDGRWGLYRYKDNIPEFDDSRDDDVSVIDISTLIQKVTAQGEDSLRNTGNG
ncbi:MAG: UDP-2,3-diacylglucosamine diphosphatase [Cryomorphaceae bacterium]|nr:UDP-2,3-diacylglucosamine diphosphatase [Cryomorphaceae bacterium]